MDINKNISESLGIVNTPTVVETPKQEVLPPVVDTGPDHQDEDYALVRHTLRSLIERGNDAIEEIAQIARQNESARGFEVVANLIKTVGETSKDLYNLQKTKRDLRDIDLGKKVDETTISVDKAVFVGTTADLLKSIKAKQEAE